MRTRTLGKSGLSVGEIGLGTWGLSGEAYGPVDPAVARATVAAALEDETPTVIDTAGCYGPDGAVLRLVGEVLRDRGRDRAFLVLRVGTDRDGIARKRFDRASLAAQTDAALAQLGTDHVDALLLHNPLADTVRAGEALGALQNLRVAGKTRLLGVSIGSVDVGRAALAHEIDVLELPYNLLFPKMLHTLAAEVATRHVGVLARSTLAYGLLAGTWKAGRKFVDHDHRLERWGPDELAARLRQRDVANGLVHDHVKSMREGALRFVLANGLVTTAVVGARTPEQARQNAHAADELPYLAGNDLATIGDRLRKAGVEF